MDNLILVAAYPRSGSTWLTRLLGDLLNSTTAGSIDTEEDIVNESRAGPYLIRRGHYVLIDNEDGPLIPASHQLAWRRLTNERIVFLVRDPRDICVSGAFRWQVTPERFLAQMIAGDVAGCGRWDEYINNFYTKVNSSYFLTFGNVFAVTKYEDLLKTKTDVGFEIYSSLKWLEIEVNVKSILGAIDRQSFERRASLIHLKHFDRTPKSAKIIEQEMSRNNMRKGIVGDWRNYFTDAMSEQILNEFGWMMEKLGYE